MHLAFTRDNGQMVKSFNVDFSTNHGSIGYAGIMFPGFLTSNSTSSKIAEILAEPVEQEEPNKPFRQTSPSASHASRRRCAQRFWHDRWRSSRTAATASGSTSTPLAPHSLVSKDKPRFCRTGFCLRRCRWWLWQFPPLFPIKFPFRRTFELSSLSFGFWHWQSSRNDLNARNIACHTTGEFDPGRDANPEPGWSLAVA